MKLPHPKSYHLSLAKVERNSWLVQVVWTDDIVLSAIFRSRRGLVRDLTIRQRRRRRRREGTRSRPSVAVCVPATSLHYEKVLKTSPVIVNLCRNCAYRNEAKAAKTNSIFVFEDRKTDNVVHHFLTLERLIKNIEETRFLVI